MKKLLWHCMIAHSVTVIHPSNCSLYLRSMVSISESHQAMLPKMADTYSCFQRITASKKVISKGASRVTTSSTRAVQIPSKTYCLKTVQDSWVGMPTPLEEFQYALVERIHLDLCLFRCATYSRNCRPKSTGTGWVFGNVETSLVSLQWLLATLTMQRAGATSLPRTALRIKDERVFTSSPPEPAPDVPSNLC